MPRSSRSIKNSTQYRAKLSEMPSAQGIGERMLNAFNDACENDNLEVAALLLIEYERIVTRPPISLDAARRREMEDLVSAHNYLWDLLRSDISE